MRVSMALLDSVSLAFGAFRSLSDGRFWPCRARNRAKTGSKSLRSARFGGEKASPTGSAARLPASSCTCSQEGRGAWPLLGIRPEEAPDQLLTPKTLANRAKMAGNRGVSTHFHPFSTLSKGLGGPRDLLPGAIAHGEGLPLHAPQLLVVVAPEGWLAA